MRKLEGMFKLSHKVAVYIPTKDNKGKDLDARIMTELEDGVCGSLSAINGGATATDAVGYWKLQDGTLCKEKVRMVFSYTDNLEASIDEAMRLAEWIKFMANQEAVSVEVNNELYII